VNWQLKHRKYDAVAPYEDDQFLTKGTNMMGMQFGWHQENIIMEGFYRHHRTGRSICMYVCMFVCIAVCIYVRMYVCML
jgi:hypothetical protein